MIFAQLPLLMPFVPSEYAFEALVLVALGAGEGCGLFGGVVEEAEVAGVGGAVEVCWHDVVWVCVGMGV